MSVFPVVELPGRFTSYMRLVLRSVARGEHTPTTIAKKTASDRGTVHRVLRGLVAKGLLTQEVGTGQYFLSDAGAQMVLSLQESLHDTTVGEGASRPIPSSVKRGHNLRVKFPIVSAPVGWRESPKEFFKLQSMRWSPLGLNNVDGVQFSLDDVHVRATSNSIVMVPSNARSEASTPDLLRWLIPFAFDVEKKLRSLFPGLTLGDRPVITVGEIAHEGDPVAKLRESSGFTVIHHSDGRARIQFDRSKGPVEIEFLHPGMFDADSETWERRITQFLDSPYDYDVLGIMTEQAEFQNDAQDQTLLKLEDVARVLAEAHVRSEATLTTGLRAVLGAVEASTKQHTSLLKVLQPPEQPRDEHPAGWRPSYVG